MTKLPLFAPRSLPTDGVWIWIFIFLLQILRRAMPRMQKKELFHLVVLYHHMSCLINIDSLLKLSLYGDDQIYIFFKGEEGGGGRTRFNSSTPKSCHGLHGRGWAISNFFSFVTTKEYSSILNTIEVSPAPAPAPPPPPPRSYSILFYLFSFFDSCVQYISDTMSKKNHLLLNS